jgi:putative component of membrane protein insertase Oxa1/YidC/SpoIIIJ protein YidD
MPIASGMGVVLIEAYQRWLSPRKGFRCAYGVLHGAGTCSSVGKRIMRERGMFAFFRLMPEQFAACRTAAATLHNETPEERRRRREEERKHRREGLREWVRRKREHPCDNCNDWDDCDLIDVGDCMPDMGCSDCSMDFDGCGSCDCSN